MTIALLCLLAVQDQEFKHDELKVKFSVPKEWKLEKGDEDTLASFGTDTGLSGQLTHGEDANLSLEDAAKQVEEYWSQAEEFKNLKVVRTEKKKKSAGECLLKEYTVDYEGTGLHYAMLFAKRDAHHFQLFAACAETGWAGNKDKILKVLDSFEYTDAKTTGGGDKPTTGGGEKISNPWEAWAEGSWVEFKIESEASGMASEMTQKQTLVKKEAEELTLKVEGKMTKPAAYEMPASEMKIPLRGSGGGSGKPSGDMKELGKGEETLEIGGKKVACKWVEYEMTMGAGKGTSKVWTSDQVPGGTVKTETKSDTMKSVMVLINFEGKK